MRFGAVALCLLLIILAGCGFHPVYGTLDDKNATLVSLNDVSIDIIADRKGQILRNVLIDRMYSKNRPDQPRYHLTVKLRYTEQDLGILANATSTRALLDMYADYTLTDLKPVDAKKTVAVNGTAHSVASFDKLDQMYGTVAARESAYGRTLNEVGEQIVNRISLYFSTQP